MMKKVKMILIMMNLIQLNDQLEFKKSFHQLNLLIAGIYFLK